METKYRIGFGKTEQELVLDQLPVQGRFPDWLQGTLLRNGPGTFEVGRQRYRHWFDGLAMLHKFSFTNGQVAYANKFLDCQAYREARDTGKISYSEFATDPCRSIFSRVSSVFTPKITDSAKVSLAKLAGRFLALAETPIQVEFDPETLASVGVFNYEDRLVGQMTTVHPQVDPGHGEVYNVVTRYNALSHYNVYRLGPSGKPERIGALPVSQPAYLHSFGMTQNYIILAEFPFVVNPLDLLLWLKPYIENFRWKPERGTPFWLIDRRTGEVAGRYESEAFFAFHHVNAFERGDEIVLDIVAYPDPQIIDAYYLHRLEHNNSRLPSGILRRYRLPLGGRSTSFEVVSPECMELPHFDANQYNMQADYRFVYAVSVSSEQPEGFYNQLIKVDLESGQSRVWREADSYPGEPVFVGAPGRIRQDEGLILSVVLNARRGTSFLLALDAQTFSEVARAEIPHPVLFGYHGAYFADLQGSARKAPGKGV